VPGKYDYLRVAREVDAMLHEDVLMVWFPRCVNWEGGGFHSAFTREWKSDKSEGKFAVFQARMIWVAAQLVRRRPERSPQYLPVIKHGVKFLSDVLWDDANGGFYWGVSDENKLSDFYSDGKHLYGISFCLYSLAAAHEAARDSAILKLAIEAFRWIENHAHDEINGGYFEWMTRDGEVRKAAPDSAKPCEVPVAAFPVGFKSMNTHLHMLEAYTELYRVWPDKLVRCRLEELLATMRDRICVEPGTMNLYFTEDWKPIPQNDSYGHDVEAAYLMLEAEDVLGSSNREKTSRMARLLVDHALAYGWDEKYGGFFQSGPAVGYPEDRRKEWWVQFEGLNSLLLMHEQYGSETGGYFQAFEEQWKFIQEYLCDPEYRGVYEMLGEDAKPVSTKKGRIWKCAYHDARALLNVSERLRKLASTTGTTG
jgi:mannobiose 2-epimerase